MFNLSLKLFHNGACYLEHELTRFTIVVLSQFLRKYSLFEISLLTLIFRNLNLLKILLLKIFLISNFSKLNLLT
nr:MAG TPA: hypothetical protein [Caudoviricetes sp.]